MYHGYPVSRVRWDEAKPHMIALHLRKSTGAMSIRPHRVRSTDRHAACECESGYVTNIDLVERPVHLAVNHR